MRSLEAKRAQAARMKTDGSAFELSGVEAEARQIRLDTGVMPNLLIY